MRGHAGYSAAGVKIHNIQPSIEMLMRLADVFGVTTDYLLGRENTVRLRADGLSDEAIAHVAMLLDDLRHV